MTDERFMRHALRLAASAVGNTHPNPMVGALIVRDGEEVGAGFHAFAGAPHAEAAALEQAGARARGATLYVSLEPCQQAGRTPPCADAIIAAGIKRVVAAMEDPDEHVRGAGIARLREAGLDVEVGVCESQARAVNRAYIRHRLTGLPFVTLKMAQSLDGFAAQRPGLRTQLTGEKAARRVRRLRYEHDAVMVGANTIAIDDPSLTVRPRKRRHVPYLRIVVDSSGRMPLTSKVLREQSKARTVLATTKAMPDRVRERLAARTIEVITCEHSADGRVDLNDLLRRLGAQGIVSVLCEGGPTLASALLRAQSVQQLVWLIAPKLIGPAGLPVIAPPYPQNLTLHLREVERLDADLAATFTTEH